MQAARRDSFTCEQRTNSSSHTRARSASLENSCWLAFPVACIAPSSSAWPQRYTCPGPARAGCCSLGLLAGPCTGVDTGSTVAICASPLSSAATWAPAAACVRERRALERAAALASKLRVRESNSLARLAPSLSTRGRRGSSARALSGALALPDLVHVRVDAHLDARRRGEVDPVGQGEHCRRHRVGRSPLSLLGVERCMLRGVG